MGGSSLKPPPERRECNKSVRGMDNIIQRHSGETSIRNRNENEEAIKFAVGNPASLSFLLLRFCRAAPAAAVTISGLLLSTSPSTHYTCSTVGGGGRRGASQREPKNHKKKTETTPRWEYLPQFLLHKRRGIQDLLQRKKPPTNNQSCCLHGKVKLF